MKQRRGKTLFQLDMGLLVLGLSALISLSECQPFLSWILEIPEYQPSLRSIVKGDRQEYNYTFNSSFLDQVGAFSIAIIYIY